jgi:peptide/nickel transport system permease protein
MTDRIPKIDGTAVLAGHRPRLTPGGQSYWGLAWRRLRRHRVAMAGGAIILIFIAAALIGPLLTPYSFDHIDLRHREVLPTPAHLLGTDELGHDVLTRLLYAGRISLSVGFSAALAAALFGTLVGGVAGYYGRWIDNALMRFTDIMFSVPDLPILIILSRYLGGSVAGIIFVISIFAWMGVARLVRGELLKLRRQEFAEAARAIGAHDARILARHLIPNALAPVIVSTTLTVGGAILSEAALSFLGIGIQPPIPSWGNMLQNAQDFVWTTPWLAIWPGAMIFLTVLCFNFLGDGLRDALDPRLTI